jgi:rod shape determining protein RodA
VLELFSHDFDWLILLCTLILIGIGLLTLFSVGHVPEELRDTFPSDGSVFFEKQIIWSLLGLVVMAIAFHIPFNYYESSAVLLYAAGIIMLVLVFFLGGSTGANRWIVLGGFRFQPSEFMKIAVIFLLARYLAEKRNNPNNLKVFAIAAIIALVPFPLVVKQPDLGTALVFPAILIPILYWRGLNEGVLIIFVSSVAGAFLTVYSKWSLGPDTYPYPLLFYFLLILAVAYRRRRFLFQSIAMVGINLGVMLVVPTLWDRMHVYQQGRILAFLRPESDILGSGWQVYQSKVAIGSGGFWGKQFLHGTQKLLAFLPERHSDFIYSVLSEELGFLGSLVVLVLFAVIIVRTLFLSTKVKNRFASIAAIGICAYFAFHVIVNIGMTVGLAPVTGLPLPFLSHGGSSMLVSCFLIGVLLNFSVRFYEY